MLPLDAHAHIEPDIHPDSLTELNACVIAMTRSLQEFESVRERHDSRTVWAVGSHPALPSAHRSFSVERFAELLQKAAVVGELGLDRRCRVDMSEQLATLHSALGAIRETPRIVSLHSVGATSDVLDALDEHRVTAPLLHWWRGDRKATERAIEAGCYFSVNAAEAVNPKVIEYLPPERVLTETDHPFGDKKEIGQHRPGHVPTIEEALGRAWNADLEAVRRRVWENLGALITKTKSADLWPRSFQATLLTL